jgi:hypothetical protein
VRTLDKELIRKLNKKGFDVGVKEEKSSEVRKKELERLSSVDENTRERF